MLSIREERPGDRLRVREINLEAFGQAAEADLVDRLRARAGFVRSLVAELDGELVGHVLITNLRIEPEPGLRSWAIGPLAVLPDRQRCGIGSRLMEATIDAARRDGIDSLFLVGDPEYYRRFGFRTSAIGNDFGIKDEFLVLELNTGCLRDIRGVAHYEPEFSEFED